MEFLQGLFQLEIAGCNEITEQGLWSSLHPRLVSVTINDCINVADECICAVTQLLPSLYEFNLQAYHVTDSALSYFSPKQTSTLNILRLQSCWEITNHGIVNIGMYEYTRLVLKRAPGLVSFVPALAYHFCLASTAQLTQPGAHLLGQPCILTYVNDPVVGDLPA